MWVRQLESGVGRARLHSSRGCFRDIVALGERLDRLSPILAPLPAMLVTG